MLCILYITFGNVEMVYSSDVVPNFSTSQHSVFISNIGQVRDEFGKQRKDILFSASSQGVSVYFYKGGYSYVFNRSVRHSEHHSDDHPRDSLMVEKIDVKFIGSLQSHSIIPSNFITHQQRRYYLGNDMSTSLAHTYQTLTYKNIYVGIDAVFTFHNGKLKTEYHVSGAGNYHNIRLKYHGMSSLKHIGKILRCESSLGTIIDGVPFSYYHHAPHIQLPTSYKIHGDIVSFLVKGDVSGKEFILDPVQEWSTFLGGSGIDQTAHVAIDKQRNVVVMGRTFSNLFPTKNERQTFAGKSDAWIAKFSERGDLLWSTFYGGSDDEIISIDHCDIVTDSRNNIIFTGCTRSSDLLMKGNPFQSTFARGTDTFIGKMSDVGDVIWSTYCGGLDNDDNLGITVDASDNIYITGNTGSGTIPLTTRPTSLVMRNSRVSNDPKDSDAFLFKLSSAGEPQWFQFIGGTMPDYGLGIATLRDGSIVITGYTKSNDFPVQNAIQQSKRLDDDGFVMRFDAIGNIAWSTFFGGDLVDQFRSIAFDSSSSQRPNIIVAGITNSVDLPITGGYTAKARNNDALIASFTYDGGLIWYRLFGGVGSDEANAVSVDPDNNILLCGYTTSDDNSDFPLIGGFQPKYGGNPDGFLSKYSATGSLQWSSYLGGNRIDKATDIAVDGNTNFVVVGYTSSKNFPVTSGAYQTVHGDVAIEDDGFVSKICNIAIPRAFFKDPQQPREYCKGGTTTLIATNTSSSVVYDSYQWVARKNDVPIPVPNNTTSEFSVPSTLDSGEYKFVCLVTNSKNCPAASDTIIVRVNEAPTIITKPYKICKGESIRLDSVRVIGNGSYTYLWNNGRTLSDSTIRNPLASPTATTSYLLTVTDSKGCSRGAQLLVEVLDFPIPVITAIGDTSFCEGGSVTLDAGAGFASYVWSNGATTPTITVQQSGVFSVNISTSSGCNATSLPKRVSVFPLPQPTILRNDDELATQQYTAYQWLDGSVPIVGATNKQFTITKPGTYTVLVTDSNGCSAQAPPFEAQIIGTALFSMGSDSAAPGSTVVIPLRLVSSSRLDMIQANQYRVWCSYNSTVLRLRSVSSSVTLNEFPQQNGRASFLLSGIRSGISGVLTDLTFDVALGNEELSSISIDSVRWTTPSIVRTTPTNGTFLLLGLCKRVNTRLFSDTEEFGIAFVAPNPSSTLSTVEFTIIEDAPATVTMYSVDGRLVRTIYSAQLSPGHYELSIPTFEYAAGTYRIELTSGNLRADAPLIIHR